MNGTFCGARTSPHEPQNTSLNLLVWPYLGIALWIRKMSNHDHFIKVPNSHYLRAWDLVRDVNCGKEVFLLDISIRSPHSLIINPLRPKGGNRLRKGAAVLVTNESMLWLVSIGRDKNDRYTARCESNSSRPSQSQDSVSRIPESVDPALLARLIRVAPRRRKVLERPARDVQFGGQGPAPRSEDSGSSQVLQRIPDGALING